MTFTTWKPGNTLGRQPGTSLVSLVGLPDVVQRIPQETAPGGSGKGRIGARLISHADNTGRIEVRPAGGAVRRTRAGRHRVRMWILVSVYRRPSPESSAPRFSSGRAELTLRGSRLSARSTGRC